MYGYIPQEMLEPYRQEVEETIPEQSTSEQAISISHSLLKSRESGFAVLMATASLLLFSASTLLFSAGKLAQVLTPPMQATAEPASAPNPWGF